MHLRARNDCITKGLPLIAYISHCTHKITRCYKLIKQNVSTLSPAKACCYHIIIVWQSPTPSSIILYMPYVCLVGKWMRVKTIFAKWKIQKANSLTVTQCDDLLFRCVEYILRHTRETKGKSNRVRVGVCVCVYACVCLYIVNKTVCFENWQHVDCACFYP